MRLRPVVQLTPSLHRRFAPRLLGSFGVLGRFLSAKRLFSYLERARWCAGWRLDQGLADFIGMPDTFEAMSDHSTAIGDPHHWLKRQL